MSDLEQTIRAIVRDELAKAKPSDPAPELVTVDAYAAARSISPSTVRAAIRDGRLPAVKIGRAVRVRMTDEIARPARNENRADAAVERARMRIVR